MNLIQFLPLIAMAICMMPLVFGPKRLGRKKSLILNLALFSFVLLVSLTLPLVHAAEAATVANDIELVKASGVSWAYISAALAVGIGSIGAGLAVAAAAPAAIGALAENENTFGKAMIFVGLGEGLAIFGLLVSILILQKV